MKKKAEIGLNLFLTVIAVYAFVLALNYKYMGARGAIGPGFIPRWVAGTLAVANILNIVLILFRKDYGKEEKFFASKENLKRVVIFFLMIIAYSFGVIYIGMYVSTAIFMIAVYRYFDKMSWKSTLIPTAGTLLFMYLVFTRLLHMMLPARLLF